MEKRARLLPALITVAAFCIWGAAPATAEEYTLEPAPVAMEQQSPYVSQCQLGSLTADAVRALADSDIAVVNTGELTQNIGRGVLTEEDIRGVFARDRELATAEITPTQLWAMLERSVSQVEVDPATERFTATEHGFEGFLQISGFSFRYDATAYPGEKVLSVTVNGAELARDDAEPVLSLCATVYMLDGGYGYDPAPYTSLGATLGDALTAYIRTHPAFETGDETRIGVIGARETMISGLLPRWMLLAGSLMLILCLGVFGGNLRRYDREYGRDKDMQSGWNRRPTRRRFR